METVVKLGMKINMKGNRREIPRKSWIEQNAL